MKRLSIGLSILMVHAAMALPALAQDSSDEFTPGAYVQAAFAVQFQTSDVKLAFSNSGLENQAYGGSIAAGYFLTNWLALQARAQFIDSGSVTAGGQTVSTMTYIYTADAKLYVLNLLMNNPNGLIQPYAIAGLGGYSLTYNLDGFNIPGLGSATTQFTFELGAGLDLMFTDHLGVFGEFNWQYITTPSEFNINAPSNVGMNIGVTYRF